MKSFFVYILSNKRNGTIYTGITNNLIKRVYEHKQDFVNSFTSRYGIHKLVYFEQFHDVKSAIEREKQLKKWYRKWKIELIEKDNSEWNDLYNIIV
jgi:putative endonuclease